jgi:hypothetical protein
MCLCPTCSSPASLHMITVILSIDGNFLDCDLTGRCQSLRSGYLVMAVRLSDVVELVHCGGYKEKGAMSCSSSSDIAHRFDSPDPHSGHR